MSNFWEKDHGFKDFMAQMTAPSGDQAVFIGYLRDAKPYKPKGKSDKGAPITMAQIAAVNEFGSRDGNIPERSFMRSAIAKYSRDIEKLAKKLSVKVFEGVMPKGQALGILGQFVTDKMRAQIDSNVPPANAPSTVTRKGSSKTLVDTGQLIGALDWELRKE